MNQTLISVIIPVFNGEPYLEETLKSVLSQSHKLIEVIVIDDGSFDGSADIVNKFPSIHYVYQSNQGVAEARNKGLEIARGDYISFLDQDDIWDSSKLSLQLDYLEQNDQIGFVLCLAKYFLEQGIESPSWFRKQFFSGPKTCCVLNAALIRKNVFECVGRFDSKLAIASDTDWFVRAQNAGVAKSVLGDVLLHIRIHDSNHSSESRTALAEMVRVAKRSIDQQRRKEI